jgi:hypothetical protein
MTSKFTLKHLHPQTPRAMNYVASSLKLERLVLILNKVPIFMR